MNGWQWSLVTMAASIGGLVWARWSPKAAWRYGIACQGVWIVEGVYTHRPGDIGLSLVFTALYVINLRTSRQAMWVRARRGQTLAEALEEAWLATQTATEDTDQLEEAAA